MKKLLKKFIGRFELTGEELVNLKIERVQSEKQREK